MILAIVRINLTPETDRATVLDLYRRSAAKWVANPDLVEKYYVFDEARGVAGGVYVWPDLATAERWHGSDYCHMIASLYSTSPLIEFIDALIHVDPALKRVKELHSM